MSRNNSQRSGWTTRVRRVDGNCVVPLPSTLCDAVGIGEGTEVTLHLHGEDTILVQPIQARRGLRPRRPIKELMKQGGPTVLREDAYMDSGPIEGELI